jgi:dolichyl-phosphate beta-glucosyltransferase
LDRVRDYLAATFESWDIIGVDDGSTDGTLNVMRKWAAENKGLRIVSYKPNVVKGYAVRQGVFAADGEFIAFSDADLSAPIEEVAKLFDAIK